MPQRGWSNKRERQYEHIKDGLRERARRGQGRRDRGRAPSTRNEPAPARPRNRVAHQPTTSPPVGGAGYVRIAARAAGPVISSTTRPARRTSGAGPR